MDYKHKQATTTSKIRPEIKAITSTNDSELARQFGESDSTIRCWRYRSDVHGRLHTRYNLLATLASGQGDVLIAARETLRLDLDGLLIVAREFLNPWLSRSSLYCMLSGEKRRHKPFKDYVPR